MTPSIALLAFGFGSQLVLFGMILAGIPVLLHLLHRRQFIETRWAAMRFLVKAYQKQTRRARIEELLLLLIRTLVIAAFVFALARPQFDSTTVVDGGSTHRIIVLDASYSMQYLDQDTAEGERSPENAANQTRFDKAKKLAMESIRHAHRGDLWNVVRISHREPMVVIKQASGSAEFVTKELESLVVSNGAADLLHGLESVLELTKQAAEVPNKEVVIYSDLQDSFWNPEERDRQQRMRQVLSEIAARASVAVVNLAHGSSPNASITDLRAEPTTTVVNKPLQLVSQLRNSSPSVLLNQIVDLRINDRLVDTKRVDLPPHSTTSLNWDCQIHAPGEHIAEIHLEDDALPIDNRRRIVLSVRGELNVLVVDGSAGLNSANATASLYVSRAISPDVSGRSSENNIRTTTILEKDFSSVSLSQFDAIILCGTSNLRELDANSIDAYVRGGRGLIVVPSESMNYERLNSSLYRDGKGVLPAKIGEMFQSSTAQGDMAFDTKSSVHPIVQPFLRNPEAGLQTAIVFKGHRLEFPPDSIKVLSLANGLPAIVAKQSGKGRALIFATSPESNWSTLGMLAHGFLPLIHEAVLHVLEGRTRQALTVGETYSLEGSTNGYSPLIHLPNGETRAAQVVGKSGAEYTIFDEVDLPGIYRLDSGQKQIGQIPFCVNPPSQEGNIAPTKSDAIGALVRSSAPSKVNQPPSRSRHSQADLLLHFAVMVTFALVVIEPMIASKSKGSLMRWTSRSARN